MKLSLSNGIFRKQGLEKNLAAIQQLGFKNIEFNMKTVRTENDTAVYQAKKLIDHYALNCLTLHSASLHVKDEVEIHRAIYYGKISLEFAKHLSAPIMTVHSNISKKLPQKTKDKCLTEIFKELNAFAEKLNIKLALENLSYTSTGYAKNVDQLEEVLKTIGNKDMGITFDFCHALETKQALFLVEKFGRRICNVHMANKNHQPFTKETPELKWFLNKMHEYNYKGPITLELNHKTPLEEIAKTKALFDKLITQKTCSET